MKTKKSFVIGDKVFAKVKGYPAWPARVESVNNKRYSVFFYGTGETATVKVEDLFSYIDHKHQYIKNLKRKDYLEAVNQIEEALLTEDNITVSEIAADVPISTPIISEKKGEKRKRDSIDSDITTNVDENITNSNKKVRESPSKPSSSAPISRSGRQIKVKRYSEDSRVDSSLSTKEHDALSDASEENSEGGKSSSQSTSRSADASFWKKIRIISLKQLEALLEHGEKMLKNLELQKVLLAQRKSHPSKLDQNLIEIVLATLPSGKKIGIKYKQDSSVGAKNKQQIKNEWERWEQETEWNKSILKRKSDLESGAIKPEDEPNRYIQEMKMNDREILTATEMQVHERKKLKLKYIREEAKLIELDHTIKVSLGLEEADPKRALDALKQMTQLSVDELMLKKHPHVVDVIKRLRRYIGNVKEWNLNEKELKEFDEQATSIRKQSDYLYDKFRSFFVIPDEKNFWVVFNERMTEFNNFTKDLSEKQVFALMGEPYTKEAFLHQFDVRNDELDPVSNKSSEHTEQVDQMSNNSGAEETIATKAIPAESEDGKNTPVEDEIAKDDEMQQENDTNQENVSDVVEKENSSQVANLPQSSPTGSQNTSEIES